MVAMHEHEANASSIDVMAARINVEAAEIAEVAGGTGRSAHDVSALLQFHGKSAEDHERDEELTKLIIEDTALIREASQRIQERAQQIAVKRSASTA